MRRIEGHVEELRCGSCGGEVATFVFSGDSDMVTAGLETATAMETGEIVIGERLPAEMGDYNAGRAQFADRISAELGRKFSPVPLIRAERPIVSPATADFSVFRRSYKPPEPVYGCPSCGGEARVIRRETAADYVMRGGAISAIGMSLD